MTDCSPTDASTDTVKEETASDEGEHTDSSTWEKDIFTTFRSLRLLKSSFLLGVGHVLPSIDRHGPTWGIACGGRRETS